jgi:hypothetical protein
MSINRPPVPARNLDRPPDDVDRLLRAFLRSEIPDPWPTLKAPETSAPRLLSRTPNRWAPVNSRLALAATMAFCLVGSLTLPAFFSADIPLGSDKPGDPGISQVPGFKPVITPNGGKAEYREVTKGKTIKIEVRLVDPPAVDE